MREFRPWMAGLAGFGEAASLPADGAQAVIRSGRHRTALRFAWMLPFMALVFMDVARANDPRTILEAYVAQAGSASAARGERLYRGKFTGGRTAESCTACHTDNPKAPGQHVRTHKGIDPLAPVAQRDRFTDAAKVEKWFKRNCNDVLGRECTVQEKADFTAYMISIR